MANRIQLRRDTTANWERVNPILEDGEPGLDITTNQIKYGDGSSTWTELAYAGGSGSVSFDYSTVQEGESGPIGLTSITGNPGVGVSLTSDEWAQLMWTPNTANVTIDNIGDGGNVYNWAYVDDQGFHVENDNGTNNRQWLFNTSGNLTLPSGGKILESTYLSANSIRIKPGGGTSTQYLEIAPTTVEGNHIHLMAGSGTELFLGNDDHYVKLADTGNVVINSNDGSGNTAQWTFGSDGVTAFPSDTIKAPAGTFVQLSDNAGKNFVTVTPTEVSISVQDTTEYNWTFGNTGNLTFPDNTIQTTAYTGSVDTGNITFDGNNISSSDNEVNIFIPSGIPTSVANWNGQGGWNQGAYINLSTTGGTGTGLTVNVAAAGGGYININAITISNPGTGYTNGDVITIDNENNLPGTFTVGVVPNIWNFSNDGTLTTPGDVTIGTGYGNISQIDTIFANNYAYANGVSILDGVGSTGNIVFNGTDIGLDAGTIAVGGVLTIAPNLEGQAYLQLPNDISANTTNTRLWNRAGNVEIGSGRSGMGGGVHVWYFNSDGSTTFPTHKNVSITGNLTVGNLTVNGSTTTISTNSYVVTDNIVQFADGNPADTLDVGFVAHRTVDSALQHTGLVRDASTGQWKLFSNVAAQPGSTVDFTGVVYDDLELGTLYSTLVNTGNITANLVSALNLHITSSAPGLATGTTGDLEGDIRVDSDYLYYCTQDWTASSWIVGWEGATSNTLFITKGDYPTPQVGWVVSNVSGYGPWTIDTVTDNGSNWQITWVGASYGQAGGGNAALTNPNPAAIWKTVPLDTFQTSAYSNTKVASYLPTYSGNIGNVSTTANVVTTGYFIGNGALLTGIVSGGGSTYSNANVASYLPTYSGNITAGNITATGNITANIFVSNTITGVVANANTTITAGTYTTTFDTAGNVTAQGNVVANYLFGNGAFLTGVVTSGGSSNYANANVAVFLSSFGSNTISTTGNVTVGNVIGTHYGNAIGTTATYTGNVNVTGYVVTSGGFGNITQVDTITANNVIASANLTVGGYGVVSKASFIGALNNAVTVDNIVAKWNSSTPSQFQIYTVSGNAVSHWNTQTSLNGTFAVASSSGTLTTTPTNFGGTAGTSGDMINVVLTNTTASRVYRIIGHLGASYANNAVIVERIA